MSELLNLLGDWHHWAFEIISGGVFFLVGLVVPEQWNPVKRLVTRHDHNKHPDLVGFEPFEVEAILRHARRFEVTDGG